MSNIVRSLSSSLGSIDRQVCAFTLGGAHQDPPSRVSQRSLKSAMSRRSYSPRGLAAFASYMGPSPGAAPSWLTHCASMLVPERCIPDTRTPKSPPRWGVPMLHIAEGREQTVAGAFPCSATAGGKSPIIVEHRRVDVKTSQIVLHAWSAVEHVAQQRLLRRRPA